MKFDSENIMLIEFVKAYGDTEIPMVALFNKTKVSEAEVHAAIDTYGIGEPQNIIIISKSQFESVFMREGDYK